MLAFGNASDGQLGLGGIEENAIYQARWNKHIKDRHVVAVGCGLKHTLLLLKEGRVMSCGNNEKGQLGQSDSMTRPGLVSSLRHEFIEQVDCGHYHSLALSRSGRVYSWGDGQCGQLGLGPDSMEPVFEPREVTFPRGETEVRREVIQIACGARHNLALSQDGQVYSWGENNHHQLGVRSESHAYLAQPTLITSLQTIPIVHMSAGFAHNVVITTGGVALAWGRNSYGQLGIGTTKDQAVPCHLGVLASKNKVARYAACGDEHTLILTQCGEVYSCGLNTHGQLGVGSKMNKDLPTWVKLLDNNICQVACGRMHSAAVSYPQGDVFMFGQSTLGQVGVAGSKPQMLPAEINLGGPPKHQMTDEVLEMLREAIEKDSMITPGTSKRLKQEIPPEGSSVDPMDFDITGQNSECIRLVYAPQRVFCGGDQTFIKVDLMAMKNSLCRPSIHEATPSSITTPPIDLRSQHSKLPSYMTTDYFERKVGVAGGVASLSAAMTEVFSSAALINGSFLSSDETRPVSESHPSLDFNHMKRVRDFFKVNINAKDAPEFGAQVEKAIQQCLESCISVRPCCLDGLRCLLIIPFWLLSAGRFSGDILQLYIRSVAAVAREDRLGLAKWFFQISIEYAADLWLIVKKDITSSIREAQRKKLAKDKDFFPQATEKRIKSCLQFVQDLYKANKEYEDRGIANDKWRIPELFEFIDIAADYFTFLDNKPTDHIVWCRYPFLLDTGTKSAFMHIDCLISMRLAVTEAYTRNFHQMYLGQMAADMSPRSFVLMVDRNNLVDSTVVQLSQSTENFKKPLMVQFIGEEGEDGGGIAKEFFMLLSQKILNPDFGMFAEDEESHLLWFRDGELFYEQVDYFKIIGILCGLAVYNSITVYLPFPMALYKKLLNKNPSFRDFQQMFPSLAKGMDELLKYSGDDFESEFDLNFTITRHIFGEVVVKELVPNGEHMTVTKDNRQQYCQSYMDYYLKTSIDKQFNAFKEGFMRVCEGKVLKLLDPEDLMLLMVGDQVQDWAEMKKVTEYKNGYNEDSQVIVYFWEVFEEFSEEQKKKFLVFLTGTNRIPLGGFQRMRIYIQRMDGGPKCERLPVAHTCFNVMDLPPYPTKHMLRDKLLQAMHFTSGFGLV